MIIDARDHNGIDFYEDAAVDQHLQAFLLLFDQYLGTFNAVDSTIVPEYPRINFSAYLGINTVNRYGNVINVMFGQFVHRFRERQAIG